MIKVEKAAIFVKEQNDIVFRVDMCCESQSGVDVALSVVDSYLGKRRLATLGKQVSHENGEIEFSLNISEPGRHCIEAELSASNADGWMASLYKFEKLFVEVLQPLPLNTMAINEGLALCGVDIPQRVDSGVLRVFVALARLHPEAASEAHLIIRDTLPSGTERAAVVSREIYYEASAFGLEVPMIEEGEHSLSMEVAYKNQDGELIQAFKVDAITCVVSSNHVQEAEWVFM